MQRRRSWVRLGLIAVAAVVLGLVLMPRTWLEVQVFQPDQASVSHRIALAPGEVFSVRFIHSVEQSWVVEEFILDDQAEVVLVATRYASTGAGLPATVSDGTFRIEDGQYHIEGLWRPMGEFTVRTVSMNRYVLVYPGGTVDLADFPQGSGMTLRGERMSWLQKWRLDRGGR